MSWQKTVKWWKRNFLEEKNEKERWLLTQHILDFLIVIPPRNNLAIFFLYTVFLSYTIGCECVIFLFDIKVSTNYLCTYKIKFVIFCCFPTIGLLKYPEYLYVQFAVHEKLDDLLIILSSCLLLQFTQLEYASKIAWRVPITSLNCDESLQIAFLLMKNGLSSVVMMPTFTLCDARLVS